MVIEKRLFTNLLRSINKIQNIGVTHSKNSWPGIQIVEVCLLVVFIFIIRWNKNLCFKNLMARYEAIVLTNSDPRQLLITDEVVLNKHCRYRWSPAYSLHFLSQHVLLTNHSESQKVINASVLQTRQDKYSWIRANCLERIIAVIIRENTFK